MLAGAPGRSAASTTMGSREMRGAGGAAQASESSSSVQNAGKAARVATRAVVAREVMPLMAAFWQRTGVSVETARTEQGERVAPVL